MSKQKYKLCLFLLGFLHPLSLFPRFFPQASGLGRFDAFVVILRNPLGSSRLSNIAQSQTG
jgi:hypothetical protein